MKRSTGIRMLLRSPVKTVVTLVLIAAASFLFLYNLLDYAMTKREYDRNYGRYHGYFTIQHPEDRLVQVAGDDFFLSDKYGNPAYAGNPPYELYHLSSLTGAELEHVSGLPYISETQKRYMTGGIADFPRLFTYDRNLIFVRFLNTSRLILEGTFEGTTPDIHGLRLDLINGSGVELGIKLTDVKVLYGNEEYLKQSRAYINKKKLFVWSYATIPERADNRPRYAWSAATFGAYSKNWISTDSILDMEKGQRYILVVCADPYATGGSGIIDEGKENNPMYDYVRLGDDSLYGVWDYITPLAGEPENYLETEKFAPLRELMQLMEQDKYTLDVHYLEDVESLRPYQEGQLQTGQGRLLTKEDSETHNPVCVIPEAMARERGLAVGDPLHLRLGDKLLEQNFGFGAVAYSMQRLAENWADETFTIVGTYLENDPYRMTQENRIWVYGENAVFVPLSFLPETADTADHESKPSEVSFIIRDADSIIPFRDEILPGLLEEGYVMSFFDGGWPAVREQLLQAGSMSLVKLCAFAASAVLVLWLTVYLYILRKKKEYAVMRALGCPASRAREALLFPLFVLAFPAVLLGCVGAVIYTRRAAEANAAEFASMGLTMDTSIPGLILAAGFCGSLLFLLILALLALVRVAGRPPLELLQGGANRNAVKGKKALPPEPAGDLVCAELPELPEPVYRSHTALRHTLRCVGRHLRRTPVKSLLAMLLALVLAFSIGFFTLLRSTYRELYRNIEIHPRILNGVSDNRAADVAKSGYVKDAYMEYTRRDCESNFVPDTLVMTTDISRVTDAEITWQEGKGPDMFTENRAFCVITRDLADQLGYELGSRLEICTSGYIYLLVNNYPLLTYEEVVEQVYHKATHKFTVAGIAEEEGMKVYTPVAAREHFGSMFPDYVPLDKAEFTLLDYHKATEFRSWVFRLLLGRPGSFTMDTGEADRIYQTYRLLELLYPILFALALILGGVLPAGIILQSAQEASLLRVLGTTKRRTRAMLSLEQAILCLLGLVLAALGLLGLKGSALRPVSDLLVIYAAAHFCLCLLGALTAAVSVTRRHVLELLQVKE